MPSFGILFGPIFFPRTNWRTFLNNIKFWDPGPNIKSKERVYLDPKIGLSGKKESKVWQPWKIIELQWKYLNRSVRWCGLDELRRQGAPGLRRPRSASRRRTRPPRCTTGWPGSQCQRWRRRKGCERNSLGNILNSRRRLDFWANKSIWSAQISISQASYFKSIRSLDVTATARWTVSCAL